MAKKPPPIDARVLRPSEYPASITASRGAYTPRVVFAAQHPLGLYYVENQGAGHHMAFFVPKRRGSRPKIVGAGGSLEAALRRIQSHEDELLEPDAPRERGENGPVNIFALGQRTAGTKTQTQLDREIDALIARGGT
jgi:hypothetical protein